MGQGLDKYFTTKLILAALCTDRDSHLARQKEVMTAAPCTSVVTSSMVTIIRLCRSRVPVIRVWQPSLCSSASRASGLHTPEVVTS